MALIRSAGNKSTELALASLFRQDKVTGWRRHAKDVTGRPDFIFPKKRMAVFVDGCFWHGCKVCALKPKSNNKYWNEKIERNRQRDKKINRDLKKAGWKVVRIWEHAIKKSPKQILARIDKTVLSKKA